MKRIALTSEWIENWRPPPREEVSDRNCRGLLLRGGPLGTRVFYAWHQERSTDGKSKRRRVRLGNWPMLSLDGARKMVLGRRQAAGQASYTATVGALLDLFIERGQASEYTAGLLRKHMKPLRELVAATLAPATLPDLVAKVQQGYEDDKGRRVGGAAVADKVRGGLRSLFGWAQRQGKFPKDRPNPAADLVREDFKGIGWKERKRIPTENEIHQLFDALGIGTGEEIEVDLRVSPRISPAARLATLLLMHAPVRSGVGLLSQPASAADLKARVLRWRTRKGDRDADLETPLSSVAIQILQRLGEFPGGDRWLVPSPEPPAKEEDLWEAISSKALARIFDRLQTPGPDGEPARIQLEKSSPFVPHSLRALWTTLAGELGVHDGVAVRVIGHKPEGGSEAHKFYDHSKREDLQREAVERVSAELERIRRRQARQVAPVVPIAERQAGG